MHFEHDPDKNSLNIEKHGISFDAAKDLWNDPHLLEISAKDIDEPRFLMIGKINDKHWSAITTYRNNNIRIISVRRSRKKEIELYESK